MSDTGIAGENLTNNDPTVLRSSSVMAVGTLLSRITGTLRSTILTAAIGYVTLANTFNTANTLPNSIYILLVGGALNAVFIPQLVRHMKDDADGGNAYADRLLTLTSTVLFAVTAAAVLLAPWIVRLYGSPDWSAHTFSVATVFARFCLPQIFFYGLYTLYAQVLNARGHFGSPMFAPIVNNVVVIGACVIFLVVVGRTATVDNITPGEISLLGIGTTLGVVAQALVLIPVLVRSGYRFRPRWDWRGQGLGTAGRLAKWTLFFVLTNQLTFIVITRLANTAGATAEQAGAAHGDGSAIYANAHLIFILPHSVVTVSVVTALLPRMSRAAHDGNLAAVRHDISYGMRLVASVIFPAMVALLLVGPQLGQLLLGYGANGDVNGRYIGTVVGAFALGMVPYSAFYVLLRGFFALQDTRTPALVNVGLNVVNVAVGYSLYLALPPAYQLIGLALGYAVAYLLSMIVLWILLRNRLGGLDTYLTVRTLVRLTVASLVSGLVGLAVLFGLRLEVGTGKLGALVELSVVCAVGGVMFAWLALRMRITEVTTVLGLLRTRLRR